VKAQTDSLPMYSGVPHMLSIMLDCSVKVASPKSDTLMLYGSSGLASDNRMLFG
jgi:hypothetical protein